MKKLLMSIGTISTIAAPVATVISCGSDTKDVNFTSGAINAVKTISYADSMVNLSNGDITVAGSFGDARFFAGSKSDTLNVVGIERKRITNDGIQVKESMKVSDQKALQLMFKDLIKLANDEKEQNIANNKPITEAEQGVLTMVIDGKWKTIFEIYSHSDYKALYSGKEIGLIDPDDPQGDLVKVDATTGQNAIKKDDIFDAAKSDFFSSACTANTIAEFKTNYQTKHTIKVQFIPSNDPANVHRATKLLQEFLKNAGVVTGDIVVSNDYNSAAGDLNDQKTDLAFLPAATWYKNAPKSHFIAQASRPLQINTFEITDTEAKLPGINIASEWDAVNLFNKYGQLYAKDVKAAAESSIPSDGIVKEFLDAANANQNSPECKILNLIKTGLTDDQLLAGSYEAWIYTKIGSDFDKKVKEVNDKVDWKLPMDDVKDMVKYGYTSNTSGASYEFPELWFNEHFTK